MGGARLGQLSDSHATATSSAPSAFLEERGGRAGVSECGRPVVWDPGGGGGGGLVLEAPQGGGVSPGAGLGLEGRPAQGWVPRPGGLGDPALGSTRAWGELGHQGAH